MSDTLYPVTVRLCLRCKKRINGYGFYSLYGYILVERVRDGIPVIEKIHGCGDAVHHACPSDNTPRRVPHDGEMEGLSHYARHVRNVSPGIDYNAHTGRYAARVDKKRLGTHATQELAEQARQNYLDTAAAHRQYRKRKTRR